LLKIKFKATFPNLNPMCAIYVHSSFYKYEPKNLIFFRTMAPTARNVIFIKNKC